MSRIAGNHDGILPVPAEKSDPVQTHESWMSGRSWSLCNFYVTMLQQPGVETDPFSSSSGTLTDLPLGNLR